MPITLGDGVITGLGIGGLPDQTITDSDLSSTFNISSKTLTMPVTWGVPSTKTLILSGNYSDGTWYTLANGGSDGLTGGLYIITFYVDTYAAGSGTYYSSFASIPFYWGGAGTNGNETQSLPTMFGTGHAPNTAAPAIRLRCTFGAADGNYYIEFNPNANWSGLNSTGGRNVYANLYRIGS